MTDSAFPHIPRLTLDPPGTAEFESTDGAVVAVRSSRPSPPGSTLYGSLPDDPRPFRVKVRGCKRVDDGHDLPFRVDGRFVEITREQRARLLSPNS